MIWESIPFHSTWDPLGYSKYSIIKPQQPILTIMSPVLRKQAPKNPNPRVHWFCGCELKDHLKDEMTLKK